MAAPYLNTGAWATTTTAMTTAISETLGALRFDGGRVLKYVVATAASTAANDAVGYSGSSGTTVIKSAAATSAATSVNGCCGISETAFVASYYGWITIFGTALASVDTTALVGWTLVPGLTAGVLCSRNVVGAVNGATTGGLQSVEVATALTTGVIAGSNVMVRCL